MVFDECLPRRSVPKIPEMSEDTTKMSGFISINIIFEIKKYCFLMRIILNFSNYTTATVYYL
jgi:hypothetical protein